MTTRQVVVPLVAAVLGSDQRHHYLAGRHDPPSVAADGYS